MKKFIKRDVLHERTSLYEMANIKTKITGEPFELWIDEIGSGRNTSHNLPRFKPKANGIQLDIVLKPNRKAEIINASQRDIQKFKYSKEAVKFIEKFQEPLLMHWHGEIETGELTAIIRLVVKKNYKINDAIEAVINDNY